MTADSLLHLIAQAAEAGWTELDLAGRGLRRLPPEIGQLSQLQTLILGRWDSQKRNWLRNSLACLPPEIGQLSSLQRLELSANQLSQLPPEIGQLSSLQVLNLQANQLTTLPPEIGRLQQLKVLDLSDNPLTTLPPEIGQLKRLSSLCLYNNQITAVPPEIGQLKQLRSLDLGDNQLVALPPEVGQLKQLRSLDLSDNPLREPPPEILKKGTLAILAYYRQQLEEGRDYLYEAKLLIVGEPGAGKTTLTRKIQDADYVLSQQQASTEGIEVNQWNFPTAATKDFRVNIWDFGGQEIYHATHQFFLTKRSLYILVADARAENTDFYYWLNVVALLTQNSPLIIVKNEKQDRTLEIDERQLRGEFNNLKEVVATNLSTNRGLELLLQTIQAYILRLEHVGTPLPKTWANVRLALEDDPRNYISLSEYLQICEQNGFNRRQDKLQLSSYLHDLGVCLHFQDDSTLKHWVILKPEWATTAVYRALDTAEVRSALGCFSRPQLNAIWSDSEYADMRDELLQLMMRFKLCYEIPGRASHYIAPQLLSIESPAYDWDSHQNLLLRYEYEFMPKGILTRFIVEMHKYIEQQRQVWKSGVVLNNGCARAEVIELHHKGEIHIRVSGSRKKDLLTVVSHELDQINDSYERLQVKKLIPCHCSLCNGSQTPYFYDQARLHQFLDKGRYTIQCYESGEDVAVRALIDDVTDRAFQEAAGRSGRPAAIASEQRKESWPVQTPAADPPLRSRLELFQLLSGLPPTQLEQLLFVLAFPRANQSQAKPQGERVGEFLQWVESPVGCGLVALENCLQAMLP